MQAVDKLNAKYVRDTVVCGHGEPAGLEAAQPVSQPTLYNELVGTTQSLRPPLVVHAGQISGATIFLVRSGRYGWPGLRPSRPG